MTGICTRRAQGGALAVAGFFLLAKGAAAAQDADGEAATSPRRPAEEMVRGAEHERLDFFIGEWEGTYVADLRGLGYPDPVHFGVDVDFEWMQPGAVWLREDTVLYLPWGPSWGHGMWTYDEPNGQLVRRWIDNQIPDVFFHYGDWVDDTTIIFDGHVEYAGGRIVMRDIFRITGPDSYVWEHFTDRGQGGEQVLSSTTTYRRVGSIEEQE